MGLLPPFNADGLLPYQDYELTIEQLKVCHLITGVHSQSPDNWDSAWRLQLVQNAEILINQLWQLDPELIGGIYLDGSFVEDKSHTNDIDGYFECDFWYLANGHLKDDLNALDPHKIWIWDPDSRKPYRNYAKCQLPMWFQYRVELYPHFHSSPVGEGPLTGIISASGKNQLFPEAFRKCRQSDTPKGIIKIKKEA